MTAYQVPPLFEHGDYPQAAGFATKYAAGLNHVEECLPYGGYYPVSHNDDDEDDTATQVHVFTFTHKHRYLHFAGNDDGQLIIADTSRRWVGAIDTSSWRATNSTSLSGSMSDSITDDLSMSVLDLDTVSGLQYGAMYHVRDVWTCIELPTEDVTSITGGSWTAPPSISDGDILTAANLNIYSTDLEYLRSLNNRPNEPFKGKYWDNTNGGDIWYYSLRKSQQHDYLYYWFEGVTGDTTHVKIKSSSDGTTWSSDYISAVDTNITDADSSRIRTGYIDISALSDDTLYVIQVDVSLSGALFLYTLHTTATNT